MREDWVPYDFTTHVWKELYRQFPSAKQKNPCKSIKSCFEYKTLKLFTFLKLIKESYPFVNLHQINQKILFFLSKPPLTSFLSLYQIFEAFTMKKKKLPYKEEESIDKEAYVDEKENRQWQMPYPLTLPRPDNLFANIVFWI